MPVRYLHLAARAIGENEQHQVNTATLIFSSAKATSPLEKGCKTAQTYYGPDKRPRAKIDLKAG